MANVLLLSDTELFRNDLKEQFNLYIPDFEVFENYAEDVIFDAAIIDDSPRKIADLQGVLRQTPIFFLGNDEVELPDSVITVNKPFKLNFLFDTLLSRINLFSRRSETRPEFGNYIMDTADKTITCKQTGKTVKLTEREIMILNYLYKAYPKTVSKNRLLSEVWEYNPEATTHTVETHIYRLRQKIEDNKESTPIIITEESGYKLNF